MTLYLYELHSYYNRKIVRYRYLYEYDENLGPSSYVASDISFNPNDGISTSQIVNYTLDHPYYEGTAAPSYCIVADDMGNIVSRWWITNYSRIRKGQVNLSLLRDVIADFYDDVMTAPSFVRKGFVSSINDPAIFNNEEMTFNQIKTKETPIKDGSQSAWYVGYMTKSRTAPIAGSIPKNEGTVIQDYTTWDAYPYSQYEGTSNPFLYSYIWVTYKTYFYGSITPDDYIMGWDKDGNLKTPILGSENKGFAGRVGAAFSDGNRGFQWVFGKNWQSVYEKYAKLIPEYAATLKWDEGIDAITGMKTSTQLSTLLAEQGKIYKIGNEYYEIYLEPYTANISKNIPNSNVYADKFRTLASHNDSLTTNTTGDIGGVEFQASAFLVKRKKVIIEEIPYSIPTTTRQCLDAPYDLFAIPAHTVNINGTTTSAEISRRLISDISKQGGLGGESPTIYDVQLVPYAPIDDKYMSNGTLTLPEGSYTMLEDNLTFIYYPDRSSFKKRLNTATVTLPNTITAFKVANECDMYRLCSPNYNGQFEFSATKNGGILGWNIAFTYKPVSPYIRVAPIFGRLYGEDFGDARGLVCGGDFSLAQVNDKWLSYERQNKNYQVMFDRQIENMEVNNSVQRIMEKVNMATGTVSGAVSGGMAGGMTGNPYAAAAGAVIGGVASFGGGIADRFLNEKLRNEAINLSRDQFGYQLQNIRALPQSLTKTSAYNADNKIFPFVEYYTCTDIEKQALLDKMAWNGMTIMRIGQIQEFLLPYYTNEGTFIQAKPIRLDYVAEDSHLAEAIAAELNTGVYII